MTWTGVTEDFEQTLEIDNTQTGAHDDFSSAQSPLTITVTPSQSDQKVLVGASFYPISITDSCTCPGAGNNWEIDMSDGCNITNACDLTTGTLSFTGSGICYCNASIDTTNLGDPGSGVLEIQNQCLITID